MSKLNELKKEIQRLRPEIMELKFGCRFKAGENEHIIASDNNVIREYNIEEPCICVYKKDITEVLGRPITLEDVMAVLSEKYPKRRICVCSNGMFIEYFFVESYWDLKIKQEYWIMGRPLDDQSEETINFIHSLICK